MGDVPLLAAKGGGQRQRCRHQPGILAGEEAAGEVAIAFGDQSHPVALAQPGRQHAPGQIDRLFAQPMIGENLNQNALARIEIEACRPLGCVIQGLRDCAEIGVTLAQPRMMGRGWLCHCMEILL